MHKHTHKHTHKQRGEGLLGLLGWARRAIMRRMRRRLAHFPYGVIRDKSNPSRIMHMSQPSGFTAQLSTHEYDEYLGGYLSTLKDIGAMDDIKKIIQLHNQEDFKNIIQPRLKSMGLSHLARIYRK